MSVKLTEAEAERCEAMADHIFRRLQSKVNACPRCEAMTRKGVRCTWDAAPGERFCRMHLRRVEG